MGYTRERVNPVICQKKKMLSILGDLFGSVYRYSSARTLVIPGWGDIF